MKHKSLIAKFSIIIILTLSFVNSYSKTSSLVYADTTTDQWTSVTTNEELAQAFQYYCKSRNLFIDGSVLGSATKFTTQTFDNICNTLGINMSALQADIKKSTDKNGGLQFLFNQSGVSAYNRIFAELLQNHDLQEGDNVENDIVYSGDLVKDADGNTALAYYVTTLDTLNNTDNTSSITAYGSLYKYTSEQLVNMANIVYDKTTYFSIPFNDNNGSHSIEVRCDSGNTVRINTNVQKYTNNGGLIYLSNPSGTQFYKGFLTIAKYNGNYYCGIFSNYYLTRVNSVDAQVRVNNKPNWRYNTRFYPVEEQATTVSFTTNNTTINSNTYTDNRQTVINNEGDVNNYDYDDEDPPVNPPSGGGDNVDIDFPNFNFNIPDIDFSLKGLTDKFPFCIPFDMVALLQLLNAEPQAPRIQGQIPFGSFFTWNLDLDFSRFNDFAVIMRGLEFVGFIFFLIGATINVAKG